MLTPRSDDPKRKEELKRKELQPGTFGPDGDRHVIRNGVAVPGHLRVSLDANESDSRKVQKVKATAKHDIEVAEQNASEMQAALGQTSEALATSQAKKSTLLEQLNVFRTAQDLDPLDDDDIVTA